MHKGIKKSKQQLHVDWLAVAYEAICEHREFSLVGTHDMRARTMRILQTMYPPSITYDDVTIKARDHGR